MQLRQHENSYPPKNKARLHRAAIWYNFRAQPCIFSNIHFSPTLVFALSDWSFHLRIGWRGLGLRVIQFIHSFIHSFIASTLQQRPVRFILKHFTWWVYYLDQVVQDQPWIFPFPNYFYVVSFLFAIVPYLFCCLIKFSSRVFGLLLYMTLANTEEAWSVFDVDFI